MPVRKPKTFKAAKEVKRRARASVGAAPPSRVFDDRRIRPPKHKKRRRQEAMEAGDY